MKKLKVNLIVPGGGKCGTSSLHEYLNQHPQIAMSAIKEPHFFSMESRYDLGFEYYDQLFETTKNAVYFGESSTTYIGSKKAIDRIQEYVPDAKFIVILRDPVERCYSHYKWMCSLNLEKESFRDAYYGDMNIDFDPNSPVNNTGFRHYFLFSRYYTLLKPFYEIFGANRIHVLLTEDLKQKPLETLNRCFDFLGLNNLDKISTVTENVTPLVSRKLELPLIWKIVKFRGPKFFRDNSIFNRWLEKKYTVSIPFPELGEKDKAELSALLEDEVEKLRLLTGRDFNSWKNFVKP